MVEYITEKSEKIPFGRNNFIEVARKRAKDDRSETEFISISRGYFLPDETERYKKSITIPMDVEIREFISKKILEI